jgi:hypothetical protein
LVINRPFPSSTHQVLRKIVQETKDANKELIYCVACRKTRQRLLLSGDGIQPNTPGQESWQYGASQSD